jgi:hypothetical protein
MSSSDDGSARGADDFTGACPEGIQFIIGRAMARPVGSSGLRWL